MQTHKHRWINRTVEDGTRWPDYTVTVWWDCYCGAKAVHVHTFRPPSVQSEQLEANTDGAALPCWSFMRADRG